MKTLHAYLTRQILASLLMTVAVFTLVLVLGNGLRDILPLLISGQMRFGLVAQTVGFLVPFVWMFALPMGMLTATLLIFGRFSADQELTAVRASGISLLSLVSPILLLSLALCAVSALLNMDIGPRSRVAFLALKDTVLTEFSGSYLPEGCFIKASTNYLFYVGKNRNRELQDVMVFVLKDETTAEETLHAERGKLVVDSVNNQFTVFLYNVKGVTQSEGKDPLLSLEELQIPIPLAARDSGSKKPSLSDMTFLQLCDELRSLERLMKWPVSKNLTAQQLRARSLQLQLQRHSESAVLFHMHRQVAFSFACFGFTLIGIPLGIRVHRRETNIGIVIALLLVAVYYGFILVGQTLDRRPEYAPHLIVWLPNLLFQGVGAVLLWRANRG